MTPVRGVLVGVAALGIAIDQLTKQWAIRELSRGARFGPGNSPEWFNGLLSLRLVRNPGAAFSFGENATIFFSIFALVVFVGLGWWSWRNVHTRRAGALAGLALAGIGGNLIDRLFREPGFLHGEVIDFISVKYFAVFNVADIFITGTAVILIASQIFPGILGLSSGSDGGSTSPQTAAGDNDQEPVVAEESTESDSLSTSLQEPSPPSHESDRTNSSKED